MHFSRLHFIRQLHGFFPVGIVALLGIYVLFATARAAESASSSEVPPSMTRASVVTSSDSSIAVAKNATFSWHVSTSKVYEDPRLMGNNYEELLKFTIREVMESKGFRFQKNSQGSQLLVSYTAALSSALDDKTLQKEYGLQPGLVAGNVDKSKFEKGTLIIEVTDSTSGSRIWRAAMQGFAGFHLRPEVRKERLTEAVKRLLKRFPARSK